MTIGQVIPTTLGWTGLPGGNRYLGRVISIDSTNPASPAALAATQVEVSTR